jgi:hypothetical protein
MAVAWATGASAQSLADLARKEEARRKQVKQSSRVITNKDLRPAETPPPPVAAAPAPAPAPGADAQPPAKSPADVEEEQAKQDQQAWRQKMADARLALERSQMYADALQSKINALWADFTARDDPAQRAQIELERKRAIAEQARVKGEIESQKKAVADLEEEARRAGVPPGWIR